MSDFDRLATWAAPLLQQMQPAARSKLARLIATDLRRSQARRITAQQNPDGSGFAPRKAPPTKRSQRGAIRRRGKMFGKIKQARHLRVQASPSAATVEFAGRVARIARVHQYGLRDKVGRKGPDVRYDQRELLGFSGADRERIEDLLLQHFRAAIG
ncbi:MAG: phage virion morphogenesis protein [Pseudomonadota bacterium]|nr:phage virion morphogenesis protein [Pseudomonadota bacterium]